MVAGMSSFPCLVRLVSGSGQVRYRLGERLVDRYLEFVAGRCRPNTLRAVAFDLKTFYTVIRKDPAERSGPRPETAASPCIKCVLARSELEKGLIN